MDKMEISTAEIIADLYRANRELVAENNLLRAELKNYKIEDTLPEPKIQKTKNPKRVEAGKRSAEARKLKKEMLAQNLNELIEAAALAQEE